jgi:GTP-binding protein
MRFIDEALIKLEAGHGGPGCVSFRRETFEPRGGPDGGDGGAGGDVIFEATNQLSTLQDFRFKRSYAAGKGSYGSSSNKAGRDGENVVIKIPVGTVLRDVETNEVVYDFTTHGETWVACTGGRGGKGNAHFVTSTFQAPKFAQPGEEGTSRDLKLELKLIADVGIIGFPNAGKSTFISRISAARPKIADYPFTTLTPNLGVVEMPELKGFVVADIPGLIEGAHRGMGLGHRFLKHIERTRLFLHVLDGSAFLEDCTQPTETLEDGTVIELTPDESVARAVQKLVTRYKVLRNELGLFNESLLHKPEMVAINKFDLFEAEPAIIEKARKALRDELTAIRGAHPIAQEPYLISAVSGKGLHEVLKAVHDELRDQNILPKDSRDVHLPDSEGIRT